MVQARPAFISNIKGIAEMIVVSPDGTRYAVGVHRRVDIYNIETAGIEYSIDMKVRELRLCRHNQVTNSGVEHSVFTSGQILGKLIV